jgi:hypothetical protein
MSTRFARRKRNASKLTAAKKTTAAEPVAVPASGDLKEILLKAHDFAVSHNPMARGRILWIKTEGNRVYAATDSRYLSNALYHALRALGRNRVRRWSEGGKWIAAYS